MEGVDVIGGVLSKITLKLGNVKGKLSFHIWPINIVVYRVINQLTKILEA